MKELTCNNKRFLDQLKMHVSHSFSKKIERVFWMLGCK